MTAAAQVVPCRTERVVRTTFHVACLIPAIFFVILWSLPRGLSYLTVSIDLGYTLLTFSAVLTLIGVADIVICTKIGRGLRMAIIATVLAATPAIFLLVRAALAS